MQDLLKTKTRILVTHAIEFIQYADRIIIMKDGAIQADGTFAELQDNLYLKEITGIMNTNNQPND